jgi:hypothetical protein
MNQASTIATDARAMKRLFGRTRRFASTFLFSGIFVLCTFLAISNLPAYAEAKSCALSQLASVTLLEGTDHSWLIPVQVGSATLYMQIAPSAPVTMLFEPKIDALNLERVPREVYGSRWTFNDHVVTELAKVPMLAVGVANMRDSKFPIGRRPESVDERAGGRLGLDFLAHFDVEFDPKNHKVNLFSSDHCVGKVVYWSQTYSQLPFTVNDAGHVMITMTLDGKQVSVLVNTLSNRTYMGFNVARKRFGVDHNSEGVVPASAEESAGFGETLYRYPFHALVAGDLTVKDPKIYLYGWIGERICDGTTQVFGPNGTIKCNGEPDISLGTGVLDALHLYFAFGENAVYFTPS